MRRSLRSAITKILVSKLFVNLTAYMRHDCLRDNYIRLILGIHTEMFSDGILPLLKSNAINNSQKYHHPGRVVTSFVYGSKKLYDFLDDNPMIFFGDVQWVNDPAIIRRNPKVTAINSAVEVDLTGQVVADSAGQRFLSVCFLLHFFLDLKYLFRVSADKSTLFVAPQSPTTAKASR